MSLAMETGTEIAIVGMAGRFPGARNIATLWQSLLDGRRLVGAEAPDSPAGASEEHWVEVGRILEGADCFDPAFFGISPREAANIDPQHRIFLETAYHALEDGGWTAADASRSVGVFGGVSPTLYGAADLVANASSVVHSLPHYIGTDKDYLTTRVSHLLGLHGPSVAVQSACSTSLVAVHLATRALLAGECDAALAGGATVMSPRRTRDLFVPGAMLSPDGLCRAFDAAANGTIFTEGVGVVLLMRLRDAVAQRRNIYGVILGSAVSNDGDPSVGFTAPSLSGQIRVLRQAQQFAGVSAADIGFIEAHGTGTVLGDAIEITALQRVFDAVAAGTCALGAIKTNIGHLVAAAGVAGLIKATLAVRHGQIPPTLHFKSPNPDLDLETGAFFVNDAVHPWSDAERPRVAGVSSFGMGGTNAHLIVCQAPAPITAPSAPRPHIIRISGKSETAAEAARALFAEHFTEGPQLDLATAAFSQIGRADFDYRLAVVGEEAGDIANALDIAGAPRQRVPGGPRTIFMFPGQGAQRPGMARELYETEPAFRRHLERCFRLAPPDFPRRVRDLLLTSDPQDTDAQAALQETTIAQPALFALEYSLASTLIELGVAPSAMIGHSVGELVAAAVGNALSLEAALALVCQRGALMNDAPRGTMLSVAADIAWITERLPESLDVAAENAPGQVVVAGAEADIGAFEEVLAHEDVASQRLKTSHAFHSRMMDGCLEPFKAAIADIHFDEPRIPFVSNVTGAFAGVESRTPEYWALQIRAPVQFEAGLRTVMARGADLFLEVGPGQALTSLCRSIAAEHDPSAFLACLGNPRRGSGDSIGFARALAGCWVAGAPVDWRARYAAEQLSFSSLPNYPFERQRYWVDLLPSSAAQGRNEVSDWMYAPCWTRALKFQPRVGAAAGSKLWVIGDDAERANAILADWRAYGGGDALWLTGEARLPNLADQDRARSLPDLVVDLRPLERTKVQSGALPPSLTAVDDFLTRLVACAPDHAFEMILCASGAAGPLAGELVSPAQAALEAYAIVLSQEHPQVRCRVLDLPADLQATELGQLLLLERQLKEREPLVAFRDGERYVRRFERVPAHLSRISNTALKRGGVYLLVGGTGRVGLMVAENLAEKYGARLILTGRRAVPSAAQWQELASDSNTEPELRQRLKALVGIRASAAELRVMTVDATNLDDIVALRRDVHAEFGALDGVLFLSGLLEPSQTAAHEDPTTWAKIMAPKTLGVENLAKAFAGAGGPAFMIVFSSISAVLGGIGHFAYAAANQYADAVVHNLHAGGDKRWVSVDWDRWKGAGSGLAGLGGERFDPLAISAAEGGEALAGLIALPPMPQVVVSTHDLEARLRSWRGHVAEAGGDYAGGVRQSRPSLGTRFEAPQGELEARVAGLWQELLGLDQIGRNDEFFSLGGDSLMGVKMIGRLRKMFGVEVSLRQAFDNMTVVRVAELIDESFLKLVESLSDEEAGIVLRKLEGLSE